MIGKPIGRYRIVAQRERGSMRGAYEAVQTHPDRRVAAKVFPAGIAASPAHLA